MPAGIRCGTRPFILKAKLKRMRTALSFTARHAGRVVEEESYFFRLSDIRTALNYTKIIPIYSTDSRRNEIIKFVEGGLKDLSVSRTAFDWGCRFPTIRSM